MIWISRLRFPDTTCYGHRAGAAHSGVATYGIECIGGVHSPSRRGSVLKFLVQEIPAPGIECCLAADLNGLEPIPGTA